MKREKTRFAIAVFSLMLSCLFTVSCRSAGHLRAEAVRKAEPTGTVSLILHGGRHIEDIETVAILDLEGDGYTFAPWAPEFDYTTQKGVEAGAAIENAREFVSFSPYFSSTLTKRIIGEKGEIIGYEVRPLYQPFVYGARDVLEVDYFLRAGGRVKVTVNPWPHLDRIHPGEKSPAHD